MFRLRNVALIVSLFFISCNEESLPDIRGRYQGWKTIRGETVQVVAEIPALQSQKHGYGVEFEIAQTLGSAVAEKWGVRFTSKGDFWIYSPLLKLGSAYLKQQGSCGHGKTAADESVDLCFSNGHFRFVVTAPFGEVTVELTRDDLFPPPKRGSVPKSYSLDELLGRARFYNYTTQLTAERLIRAKEGIGKAKWALLPKFNIKMVVEFFIEGPLSILNNLGSIAPFLFPSKWFKWKEAGLLFEAEKTAYGALRGNQMLSVEQLFYVIRRDFAVRSYLLEHLDWLRKIQKGIVAEEKQRRLPTGSSEFFELTILPLEQDRLLLETLIQNELSELSHAVALPPLDGIFQLAEIPLPDISVSERLDPRNFFRDAQAKSLEIESLKSLLSVASWVSEERKWSFIDPSADDSGGGFDFGHTMRISRSHEDEIRKKIEETHSFLEKQSGNIAVENNARIDLYPLLTREIQTIEFAADHLVRRHLIGDTFLNEWGYLKELTELGNRRLAIEVKRLNVIHEYLIAQAKYQRLLLLGRYRDLLSVLPSDRQ